MKFELLTKNSTRTAELLDILQEEWPQAHVWLTDVIDDWSLTDFPQIIVATENKKIIGYYSLVANELIQDNHHYTPWLGTLFIAKEHRGHHYSPLLINHACQHIKKMGYSNLFLTTEHIGYYEKYGFKEIGSALYLWSEPTKIYKIELK